MNPSAIATLVLAALFAGCSSLAPRATEAVQVKVLAINDFHGNLLPPQGGIRIRDPLDAGKTVNVAAGGAAHLATAVRELRERNVNHIFVAAGDLVGASPLLSALFHDEPTIESLSAMGLEASAVGNHEFDHGAAELLRLQRGGCHASDGCKGPQAFGGARFAYLAASTIDTRSGRPLLPPYVVKRFQGIPVAFIGLTLKGTPQIVVPSGVAGLEFRDEAQTVNALVPELRAQGIEAIVVLIHEGGIPSGDYNECPGIAGPIVEIVKAFDKAVDVVISGHTHRAYNCRIDGRLVTSGDKYGTVLTEIDLTLDPKSGDVIASRADNLIVRTERFAKDPRQEELIALYEKLAAPLAKRVVGRIAAPLSRDENAAGESPLGQLIADAQLAATQAAADGGAQLALMNPGGVRAALAGGADGLVRYEDLFAVIERTHIHRIGAHIDARVDERAANADGFGIGRAGGERHERLDRHGGRAGRHVHHVRRGEAEVDGEPLGVRRRVGGRDDQWMLRIEGHVDGLGGHGRAGRIHHFRRGRHAVDHHGEVGVGVVENDGGRGVGVVRDARRAPQLGIILKLREIDRFDGSDGGHCPDGFAGQGQRIDVDAVAREVGLRVAQGHPADSVAAGEIVAMAAGRENGGRAHERAQAITRVETGQWVHYGLRWVAMG